MNEDLALEEAINGPKEKAEKEYKELVRQAIQDVLDFEPDAYDFRECGVKGKLKYKRPGDKGSTTYNF